MTKKLKKWEISYIAGIFDGEGCVRWNKMIDRKKYRKKDGSISIYETPRKRFRVTIGQHKERMILLEWINIRLTSVGIKNYIYPNNKDKSVYCIVILDKNAKRFIAMIYPFIVAKKEQIDKIINH